ncbi:MAG: hypothetical protein H6710_13625 [Myxococcales bacterium]|nr:hypothetical protein [Myxococcales bacterium]MCB9704951.1 hypothetical protein [Myxococcales bacterium]
MTYRRLHSTPLFLSISLSLSLSLVACGDVDDPGAIDSSSDSSPEEDPPPDEPPPSDDEPPPSDDEPPPASECSEVTIKLGIGDASPMGLRGKDVVDLGASRPYGVLTHAGGESSGFSLEIALVDEAVSAVYSPGGEGCEEYQVIRVKADAALISDDGTFDDLIPVTLIHHSADPASVEIISEEIAWDELGGKLQPPAEIGPEASPPEAFASLALRLRAVIGDPRPMATVGDEVLEDVQGVILGRGELAEWSCPDLEGGECDPSRDFFIGSLIFKGE